MNKRMSRCYREVELNRNGAGVDRTYHNSLTKNFQYEYALYKVVSGLFESVRCRSLCISSIESYFLELPVKDKNDEEEMIKKSGKKTQNGLVEEVSALVKRDVIGNINFPMINICAAESAVIANENGTHTLVFTDGIYGFALQVVMSKKRKQTCIKVKDLYAQKSSVKPDCKAA